MIRRSILALIRFYQLAISPHLGRWCRFEPSCSEYTKQAILLHGAAKGMFLGSARICRCHPFCPGGFDPVPPRSEASTPIKTADQVEVRHG